MQIGMYCKTFERPTLDATLQAIAAHGIDCVLFNLSSAGLADMPDQIAPNEAQAIRSALAAHAITMSAVSGTFNMIDPDLRQRQAGLKRLDVLGAACKDLGTEIITLCTGTRDPDSMWRRHPDNGSPEAWRDLVESLSVALADAERNQVTLAFEPEISNVIDTARKGRRLLDELRSPRLKVVIDPANLFHTGDLARMRDVLDEAFDLLGDDIIMGHAKDLTHDGDAGNVAAGTGKLDYDAYVELLRGIGFTGALILHGLTEAQVGSSVAFLKAKLARTATS